MSNKIAFCLKNDGFLLYTVIVLGIMLRIYFIQLPIRYGESYTFIYYVKNNLSDVFNYSLPNNHVLHSLLAYISTKAFAQNEFFLRLPSLVFGTGSILVIFITTKIMFANILNAKETQTAAIIASMLFTICPHIVLYNSLARGYTLLMFLTLIAVMLIFKYAQTLNLKFLILTAVTLALGMLTIPTMLYVIIPIYLTLCVLFITKKAHIEYQHMIIFPLVIFALTAIFYIPVILATDNINSIVNNKFVAKENDNTIKAQLEILKESYSNFIRDIPIIIIIALGTSFMYTLYILLKSRNDSQSVFVIMVIFTGPVISYVKGNIPPERIYVYILPILIVYVAAGIAMIITTIIPSRHLTFRYLFLLMAFLYSVNLMHKNVLDKYNDIGYFADAEIVSQVIISLADKDDTIRTKPPVGEVLNYYYWKYDFSEKLAAADGIDKTIFVVYKPRYKISSFNQDLNNSHIVFENERTIILQK